MQLLRAILPRGKGSEFMKTIKDDGAIVITCYYGYGSASESIQSKLKVNKIRKEIVMAILDDENAKIAMDELEEKLVKINTGVAFTSQLEYKGESNLQNESNYQALYVIVDRHEGQKAVAIAQENGAKGATLIHGRGSAKEVKSILLNMNVEPEKDIVIMLVKNDIAENIKDAIYDKMNLYKENKGIIYSLPVMEVRGLVEQS
ncbi:MAG: transcriptional regulator [Anaerococcus sp.]|jgi:nitrogen regulatory protein P-II|uniref:transcriptional regulator n=2 Tax=Peptoniphilaceae TaxID=1570339 RepID=UPI0023545EE3|nr:MULTISPECIES: transcriptional regulator [Anaerococcus]MDU7410911.1 transcriptional regulator [Anaerococcus sp.]